MPKYQKSSWPYDNLAITKQFERIGALKHLIAHSWDDASVTWSEDALQAAIVQYLRTNKLMFAADQNAGRRSMRDGARRKVLGMVAGEPDLRIYLPGGRCIFVEVKSAKGTLSPAQKDRHAELVSVGFDVHVIKEKTPNNAIRKLQLVLAPHTW
jgi:hypothetical protein